jgi:hypothetical protein
VGSWLPKFGVALGSWSARFCLGASVWRTLIAPKLLSSGGNIDEPDVRGRWHAEVRRSSCPNGEGRHT